MGDPAGRVGPVASHEGCWAWGPNHYACAKASLERVLMREEVLDLTMLTPEDAGRLLGDGVDSARQSCRLLGLRVGGVELYPGFQFSPAGELLPIVAEVNQALALSRDAWEAAAWWLQDQPRLADQSPLHVLGTCWETDLPVLARP